MAFCIVLCGVHKGNIYIISSYLCLHLLDVNAVPEYFHYKKGKICVFHKYIAVRLTYKVI